MKHIRKILLLSLFAVLVMLPSKAFALTRVSNLTELQSALAGDDDEIVVTQAIDITENTTIDGHDKTVRAEVAGVNDQGLINSNPSAYNIFKVNTTGVNFTISNMHIKGGSASAITILKNNTTFKMSDSSITNTGSATSFGSAISISECEGNKLYLENVLIAHNVAQYAGGIFIESGNQVILNNVSLINNRNIGVGDEDADGYGGGAIENQGNLYINNSVIANNYSTEIGGAINNYKGNLYIMNSTITGNVTESSTANFGGGIGNHIYPDSELPVSLFVVNSIVANNYQLNNGVYSENDIGIHSTYSDSKISLKNSVIGVLIDNDNPYTSNNVKSDISDLFLNLEDGKLIDKTGAYSTTSYKRPALKINNNVYNAYLSSTSTGATGGLYTFFDVDDSLNVKMSYGTTNVAADSTSLGVLASGTTLVNTYIDGVSRYSGVMGASSVSAKKIYKLTASKSDNGQVEGASIFGDYYDDGTLVTLSAVPATGYYLEGYEEYIDDNWVSVSKTLKYQVKMTRDIMIRAVFTNDETKEATTDINELPKDNNQSGNQINTENPNTGDNIVIYGSLLVISLLVLGVCFKLKEN